MAKATIPYIPKDKIGWYCNHCHKKASSSSEDNLSREEFIKQTSRCYHCGAIFKIK